MTDEAFMQRALTLAERGRGFVEPNPLVGAVLVRSGQIIGEGWHQRHGDLHAEVNALADAGKAARGATLFVTLEPCCHHGKTPPCTDAIWAAGVARVVAAQHDPFPQVAGRGAEVLRQVGVTVEVGLCEAEARRQNAPYLTLVTKGRPFVHAKWAMTLDGKIATGSGQSKWISDPESRHRVHELRGRMDAILVGAGTVRADDPMLTARPPGPRTPTRIVLSSDGQLPADCQLLRTARAVPVLVAVSAGVDPAVLMELLAAGCEVLELPAAEGRVSVVALLHELGRRRLTNVLVEGGSGVLGSFLDECLVDEVQVYVAPVLVGGKAALTPVGGRGASAIADGLWFANWESERVGNDMWWHGWTEPPGPS